MGRQRRIRFTDSEVSLMWGRWKQGESLASIARGLETDPPAVYHVLSRYGGVALPQHSRASRVLSLSEREEISRGLAAGCSFRSIAQLLQRSPSTISREVHRHGGVKHYRASRADEAAWVSAKRPKPCKLGSNIELKRIVASKLKQFWSPEQISGWLKCHYPAREELRVSHETIYKSLYIQTRGVLKKELLKHLRSKPRLRRSRLSQKGKRGVIPDLVSIKDRPADIEDRAIPGHWEGDLIEGRNNSFIATLVERHSRYVCLVKVSNKTTEEVVSKLIKQAKTLPSSVYQSLTWDRGSELKQHRRFTLATNIKVYFCDPKSPWQRGSNENTNRLLRQYFPKGTDLSVHSQAELNRVAKQLNQRPRKTLDYETPADRFIQCVAATS
jgi:transposase, IS30 family